MCKSIVVEQGQLRLEAFHAHKIVRPVGVQTGHVLVLVIFEPVIFAYTGIRVRHFEHERVFGLVRDPFEVEVAFGIVGAVAFVKEIVGQRCAQAYHQKCYKNTRYDKIHLLN